ncbi:MAG TPA: FHA domain-containing protein [Anaerolineae bacterium]|nr:FHA domain-containing protein [Anaerolineae bacterium]
MPYLNLSTRRTVPLQKQSFTIGSDPSCDLSLPDNEVAPRHLILQSRGDGWQIATLNLHASVTINGQPIDGLALLHDGDRIRLENGVELIWREADAPPQRGPWWGLLLIFLAVIATLSILFAIYRFEAAYLANFIPTNLSSTTPPLQVSEASGQSILQPVGLSANGHPLYLLVLPPAENTP